MPTFSILIVTYNGLHHLRSCLASLLPQLTPDWEIIVVDNASSDGTHEFMQASTNASIRHLLLAENKGFAEANNIGAATARGNWLFLLNNDTRLEDGTLKELEQAAQRYPEFDIFACKMLRMSDMRIDNCGIHFSRLLRGYQIGTGKADEFVEPMEVFGASGGAMLINRHVIEDIGLFEQSFFVYQEDVDFAVRARVAGYRCLFIPGAKVYHRGHGTSSSRFAVYHIQRNMELVVVRSVPLGIKRKYIAGHIAYSVFQILRCVMRGSGRTVLKAKFDAWLWRRKSWSTRPVARINNKSFDRLLCARYE